MKTTGIIIITWLFTLNGLSQNLTIDETLKYLTELCSSESFEDTEYIFSKVESKIQIQMISFAPNYNKRCTTLLVVDIRYLKELREESFKNVYGKMVYSVKYYMSSKTIKFSDDCNTNSGYADQWEVQLASHEPTERFIKAFTYLKNKMLIAYPLKTDPFKK